MQSLHSPKKSNRTAREILSKHLGERVMAKISGTGKRPGEDKVLVDRPSNKYFAGQIVSKGTKEGNNLTEELNKKLSPSSIQAEFLVDPNKSDELQISFSGNVYYRTFPQYEEQLPDGDIESDNDYIELKRVFRRLEFESQKINVDIPNFNNVDDVKEFNNVGQEICKNLSERLKDRVKSLDSTNEHPPIWRSASKFDGDINIGSGDVSIDSDDFKLDKEALSDEKTYTSTIKELADSVNTIVLPDWYFEVNVRFQRREDGLIRVSLSIENSSEPNPDKKQESEYGSYDYDTAFFDFKAKMGLNVGDFPDFKFERLEEDFRYDRNIAGHGTNCTVTRVDSSKLETNYLPKYRQESYSTRDPGTLGEEIDTQFSTLKDLENGGIEALRNISKAMEHYLEEHKDGYKQVLENEYAADEDFEEDDREDFEKSMEEFERELKRFKEGIKVLNWSNKNDGWLAQSFELMNETMVRKVTKDDGSKEFDSWHLFQLIFIVSLLPDIAAREFEHWEEKESSRLEEVDIVYFPTGGGKTEAYLGIAVLSAFFDRFRGKNYGVTAWTRFPLRLLSLQQTQRFAEILMYAEIIRLETDEIAGEGKLPFSLGYLVGSRNTPNKLSSYVDRNSDQSYLEEYNKYQNDEELRSDTKTFPSCPVCGSQVKLEATKDIRLSHKCTADREDCEWQQRNKPDSEYYTFNKKDLPVHIVDNELYRYAPTMVVGTIDKITAVGFERKSGQIYGGKMTHWCKEHGFSSLEECTEKYGCDEDRGGNNDPEEILEPLDETPLGKPEDSAPSLEIQDELHLLKESMGTFDGHYETFIDAYQDETQSGKTKVLGATATITEYERQVGQIYDRKSLRFPAAGPKLRENFYAETHSKTQRHFVGIMPHGKTQINAVIDLLRYYLIEIEKLREDLNSENIQNVFDKTGLDSITKEELKELLNDYETALAYTISKKEKNRLTESISNQLRSYLKSEGLRLPNQAELTSDTKFEEVESILDNLEKPPEDVDDRYNVITATNMISHGVDVDRFNYMIFFGMPRQTAEYIQSSSRVGRKHPGLVLTCFDPSRERDQSHYHMFEKYHEYLDRLVEPVPVNRWSQFSVEKTLPGIFFGWMYNQWMYQTGEKFYFSNNAAELARTLRAGSNEFQDLSVKDFDDLQDLMKKSYKGKFLPKIPDAFSNKIEKELDRILTDLEGGGGEDDNFASDVLTPSPMNSLRDIDEMISIGPENQSSNESIMDTLRGR